MSEKNCTTCVHGQRSAMTEPCKTCLYVGFGNDQTPTRFEPQTTVKHPKPPRKRSAPLYGELLNQNKRLEIENHNMRLEIQSLRMANEGLRNRLTGYDTASLSKLAALWFRNRKGGGK